MNTKGEALVTYTRSERQGAARPRLGRRQRQRPGRSRDQAGALQVRLRRRLGQVPQRDVLEDVQERLRPVRRPGARRTSSRACKAPDGTYWALQSWQRSLPLLGFDPWLPSQTQYELHLSHWSGELPKLEVYAHWTYGGEWQGLFGRLTYLGNPVHGFGSTGDGNPRDRYGRNVYIDTFNSVYGAGWRRESGILVHKPTGTFCHSFVPQKPFPGYPSQAMRPPAPGERYRITVMGPGVTPVIQWEGPRPHRGRPRLGRVDHGRVRPADGRRRPLRRRALDPVALDALAFRRGRAAAIDDEGSGRE